jgi:hypothetical protein
MNEAAARERVRAVGQLLLDYVAMCDKFGPLDLATFVEAWIDADAIARTACAQDVSRSD